MSFKDIKGQDRAQEAIKSYFWGGRDAHSYIFSGPHGVGKYLAAKTLAKAINCEEAHADSCDHCSSCIKIDKNEHPDVHIIDVSGSEKEDVEAAESDAIKIEYIRRMQKEIGLKPYEAAQKVFIINDAHNLTGESANALLKTLEEPPKDSLIILVSSRPNLLFKTVISRCKVIKFYPLERKVLAEIMRRDYLLDVQAAHYLAYFCEGRIGEAVRLKDSGMLDEKNRVIDEFILRKPGGSGYRTALDRYELRRLLNIMCAWFRDVYMLKVGLPYSELINLDRKEELLKTAATYSLPDLDETLGFLSASFLYLEQNVNPRLLLSNLKVSVRNQ